MTTGRHVVDAAIVDDYVAALAQHADKLPVGDPASGTVALGPIIDAGQRDHIHALVMATVDAGATLEAGGTYEDLFYRPTVLSGVVDELAGLGEEVFGPVAPVIPYSSEDEAVALAADSEYGLSLGILARDGLRALELSERIPSGAVHINDQTVSDEAVIPFGGLGDSGNGSRVGGSRPTSTPTRRPSGSPPGARCPDIPSSASPPRGQSAGLRMLLVRRACDGFPHRGSHLAGPGRLSGGCRLRQPPKLEDGEVEPRGVALPVRFTSQISQMECPGSPHDRRPHRAATRRGRRQSGGCSTPDGRAGPAGRAPGGLEARGWGRLVITVPGPRPVREARMAALSCAVEGSTPVTSPRRRTAGRGSSRGPTRTASPRSTPSRCACVGRRSARWTCSTRTPT